MGIGEDNGQRSGGILPHVSGGELWRVISQSPLGVHIFTPEGRSLAANATWNRLWGLEEGESPEGTNIFDDERLRRAGLMRYVEEVVESGEAVTTPDLAYEDGDVSGEQLWLRAFVYPVRDEAGGTPEAAILLEDVTERKRAEEEAYLKDRAVAASSSGIIITDPNLPDNPITYVNPRFEKITGYGAEEAIGRNCRFLRDPDEEQAGLGELRAALREGREWTGVLRNYRKDGEPFWNELYIAPVRDRGRLVNFIGVQKDITGRVRAEEELKKSEARHRAVVDTANDAIVTMTPDGTVRSFNRGAERIFGYGADEAVGRPLTTLMPERLRGPHGSGLERYLPTGEARVIGRTLELAGLRKEGEEFPIELSIAEMREGEDRMFTGIIRDITERKEFERRLEYRALHDPLTDLPNRTLFAERLATALADARGGGAVLFMDLDNFKYVNDSLGHGAGDRLLVAVARRLAESLGPEATVARFGGDEFTVLLEGASLAEAIRAAEEILDALRTPFVLDGREIPATTSIGIVPARPGQDDTEALLRDADIAMYRSKDAGKNRYQVFEPGMEGHLERLGLEAELRRAVERDEFVVYYQPKVYTADGRVSGLEALVRWRHPERGLLSPAEFVPLAEETGLILPIGRRVLEESCRRLRALQESHPSEPPLSMSVNLSARQFRDPALGVTVAALLARTGVAASSLVLEITESTVMEEERPATDTLRELKSLGVGLAIDDFGTGYSSLSYLRRLPVDHLKIDKSFVEELDEPGEGAVVQAVIQLARALGLEVVAEGVETAEQLARLRDLGCEQAQGYYFAKPLPETELGDSLGAGSGG